MAWHACRPAARGLAFAIVLAAGAPVHAAEVQNQNQGQHQPYFVSLKADLVYMREGPSTEHKVKWVYRRVSLPVEVLAQFDIWRRVRDMDGEVGWVHVALLSRERTVVVVGDGFAPVRAGADRDSPLVAEAEPGAIASIEACGPAACRVDFSGRGGWVDRARLWGLHADEQL